MDAVYFTAVVVTHSSSELMRVLVVIFPAAENNSFLIMASNCLLQGQQKSSRNKNRHVECPYICKLV